MTGEGLTFRERKREQVEAKLLQQLAVIRSEVLYVIFLDLTKAYYALDRSKSMEILKGNGVGEIVQRLMREY